MIILELPWPPKELSPNARVHWAKKAAAAKRYKRICWTITKAAKGDRIQGRRRVDLRFYPKTPRRRDEDNLIGWMKYGLDGIALALGIDDSQFQIAPPEVYPATGSEGLVRVFLSEAQ
ncbi:endonuclease [Candidimonas humi]|uniref:Endonuclease n=1 Tax=Candidimonas humi TaxID=683355 RepID=A0ABV8NUJ5_9BURK|nr:endonuclease [Candidimonas humi]MBV6304918.1 endonuclease [Candidimonas humi]